MNPKKKGGLSIIDMVIASPVSTGETLPSYNGLGIQFSLYSEPETLKDEKGNRGSKLKLEQCFSKYNKIKSQKIEKHTPFLLLHLADEISVSN